MSAYSRLPIVYEDDDCMVLEKPAGIVVNKAESVKGETVQEWVEKSLKLRPLNAELKLEEEKEFYNRAGIVHRIDKETSGLLLIAKHPKAFANLQQQFKERVVSKKYIALVHGDVKPSEGGINVPIGRLPWNRMQFGPFPGGKEAFTQYKKRLIYRKKNSTSVFSLLEVTPLTGRTHQIRVHLKYIGHPILGDSLYGGRSSSRDDRIWCPRIFLHAAYLKFKQPTTGKWIEVNSNLPDDLKEIVHKLT